MPVRIVDPIQKSGHIVARNASEPRHDFRVRIKGHYYFLPQDVAHTFKFHYAFSPYLGPTRALHVPVFRWDYLIETLIETLHEFGKTQHEIGNADLSGHLPSPSPGRAQL